MLVMSSPKSSASFDDENDYDYEDHNENYYEDFRDSYAHSQKHYSDDDASMDGSEEEMSKEEFSGIKEQMYQDKLAQLKSQLQQLRDGTHPEYKKKLKKIDISYKERLKLNDLWRDLEMECVEREYFADRRLAAQEFEEKKAELKENLLLELEDKKKIIEQERYSLELTGDSMEYKPVSTRKLRRRGNEPPPLVEKRRKPMTNALQLLLEEKDIEDDLKMINKSKLATVKKTASGGYSPTTDSVSNDPRIENGKLFFDKKWFYKGQSVLIECKDGSRFTAELVVTSGDVIIVRKVPENTRVRITLAQLAHGKYIVKKRSN
ncbi:UNVERIFIED_CONTAM: hypothetical protein RMT77_001648 [Armadillidium vulgare]